MAEETLADLMRQEQESQTTATADPPIEEPVESAVPPTDALPEETDSLPPSDDSPPPESPEIDEIILEASKATGMDLSDIKDRNALFQSFANMKRKLSERDELAKLGERLIQSPHATKALEVLQGKLEQEAAPPAPGPASEIPEWDPIWEEIVQGENPPAEILAKHRKYVQWTRNRAESLVRSEALQKFATDPEAFIRGLVDPLVGELRETQEQARKREAENNLAARTKAVLAPVEKQIFAGEWGDWDTVTPFGAKVRARFDSNPALSSADPIGRLQECIEIEKALSPQPKPTKEPPASATRAPNAGAPPIDPDSVEKQVDAALEKNPAMSVIEIQKLYEKLRGQ